MDAMMTSKQVREACGNVSDMTLWRWSKADGFPAPIKLNRRRYWRAAEVAAWWQGHAERAA